MGYLSVFISKPLAGLGLNDAALIPGCTKVVGVMVNSMATKLASYGDEERSKSTYMHQHRNSLPLYRAVKQDKGI